MSQTYNIYCDESCHLEKDRQKAMVLGAVWCPIEKVREVAKRIREIKERHSLKDGFEIKWTKISKAKSDFYLDIIDYFFDNDDLHFRGLVAYKGNLQHKEFQQSHDDWYYKMYFCMLKPIFTPTACYRIYLDIKDTRSAEKLKRLHKILCNSKYDFNREIIERVQNIRSYESEIVQLADILIGALSCLHRGLDKNQAKQAVIERMRERSKYSLQKSTLQGEEKFNLFVWKGKSA